MNKNIDIPMNDVFFYGISLRSRDVSDVRSDIFSNILMRYLTSLKPVSNKLYRTADNSKYEYSYTFVPSKPLSWRVIKNRRIIEEIEQLSDGKYCLNYYDDNGKDVKRIIFNNQHRWVKTNYYNSIYGENLLCSLIPKELNAETVILQYITGEAYPVTLRCCPLASCNEVLNNVLEKVPMPEVTALTNYGLLYYACEETRNIFSQVLSEEEKKYKEAHKPPVYNTEEDVAGGFCFDAESFDTTKSLESRFDLSMADELTDEGFAVLKTKNSDEPEPFTTEAVDLAENNTANDYEPDESEHYSIEEEIAMAIKMISDATNIHVDNELLLAQSSDDKAVIESSASEEPKVIDTEDIDSTVVKISNYIHSEIYAETENKSDAPGIIMDVEEADILAMSDLSEPEDLAVADFVPENIDDINTADLLSMDDDAIDDYVSTLIDTLLLDAQSTLTEYNLDKDNAFAAGNAELIKDNVSNVNSLSGYLDENCEDALIESNGANYYYYGKVDENGDRTGRGRTLMDDGKIAYDGEYLDDMRHGKGSFFYKDGSLCYYGDWRQNMRNGFGIGVSSETGVIHTGKWTDNRPVGIGVRFDSEGNFMYLDSASDRTNGGIRVTGFTEKSILVEVWDEKTLKVHKKEISIDDLIN